MTATDYRQLHATITRCTSELRGIAFRLKQRRDTNAATLINKMADELHAMISTLQPLRQEPAGNGQDEREAHDAAYE